MRFRRGYSWLFLGGCLLAAWFTPTPEAPIAIASDAESPPIKAPLVESLLDQRDRRRGASKGSAPSISAPRQLTRAKQGAQEALAPLPRWVRLALPHLETKNGPVWINSTTGGHRAEFDPISLQVLGDFIEENGLTEASSAFDRDDGNGRFEPWELGFQLWQNGELIVLSFGSSPYLPYGYALESVPRSIEDLVALQYLDLGGNAIRGLPEEIARLGSLRTLRLSRNQIEELPRGLGNLHALETLVVDENPLLRLPESLGGLRSLSALHLNDTRLSRLSDVILELNALEHLGLHRSDKAPDEARLLELPDELLEMDLTSLELGGNALFCNGGGPSSPSSARVPHGLRAQHCEYANGVR